MNTSTAIAHYGSLKALATALGVSSAAVCQWGEFPPDSKQLLIERITDGALKAEPGCLDRVIGFDRVAQGGKSERDSHHEAAVTPPAGSPAEVQVGAA